MNHTRRCYALIPVACLAGFGAASSTPAESTAIAAKEAVSQTNGKQVILLRTPDRGIQPQAVMDKSVLHLIYFKGDPGHGDVFYVQSKDDGATFSKPLRVNSQPSSVIATGNVRGAHLAIGAGGRAHVAWMGSMTTAPKGDHHATPMLYSRLNDAGDAFEPQRNMIQAAFGLDGGGSIAAEGKTVYVAWHAPTPGSKGEDNRRVWLTASTDEGKTFDKEMPMSPADAGSCGCCGMRLFAAQSQVFALFRGARETVHRPMFLLSGKAASGAFRSAKLTEWETGVCPMSTMAFASAGAETIAAWETEGQIQYARVRDGTPAKTVDAPGASKRRRFPAVATNGREVLLAWTENMAWNRGGGLAWQVYDAADQPLKEAKAGNYGRADGVPTWSVISAVALSDGRFAIVY